MHQIFMSKALVDLDIDSFTFYSNWKASRPSNHPFHSYMNILCDHDT